MNFEQLYQRMLKNNPPREPSAETARHLDCLLHPEKYPVVLNVEPCGDTCEFDRACERSCVFDAISRNPDGSIGIDPLKCVGCSACIEACKSGKLTASRDILPAMEAVRRPDKLSYALIAPAFLGQFSEAVTPGKLRSAFKALGFTGMVEVALFADILTLKESLEFDKNILTSRDYQLTSCCCPMWIAMIRKVYHELMPHVPGSVSPMVACGRVIKKLHPDATTVFIGPCLAKKSEAREADIKDAVDFVLTFQEVKDIFDATGIDPAALPESDKDHSSRAGRIYARAGGVSEAVCATVERLNPDRKISIKTERADGVPACRAMIEKIRSRGADANFFEGMGCVGGCVGGPKAILPRDEGAKLVDVYGSAATYPTPLENPHVLELLKRLGFDTVDALLEDNTLFTRSFD